MKNKKNSNDFIWNPDAIDYDAGVVLLPEGITQPNKIGCWVLTIKACMKLREIRKKNEI